MHCLEVPLDDWQMIALSLYINPFQHRQTDHRQKPCSYLINTAALLVYALLMVIAVFMGYCEHAIWIHLGCGSFVAIQHVGCRTVVFTGHVHGLPSYDAMLMSVVANSRN